MKIWKNTSTLEGFDGGLEFTESKQEAEIALIGSKPIEINEFSNLCYEFREENVSKIIRDYII